MSKAKPFVISKWQVMCAFELVKANAGAAGVDKQSIADFERNLTNNLYRLWNRLSSGSYFPPPIKAVAIPKKTGGERVLGIPTVSDRIAQMVVKLEFEPQVEPHFLPDSYGYRPYKSFHGQREVGERLLHRHLGDVIDQPAGSRYTGLQARDALQHFDPLLVLQRDRQVVRSG